MLDQKVQYTVDAVEKIVRCATEFVELGTMAGCLEESNEACIISNECQKSSKQRFDRHILVGAQDAMGPYKDFPSVTVATLTKASLHVQNTTVRLYSDIAS